MEVIRDMGKGVFFLGILIMVMLLLLEASQSGANGGFLKELSGDTIIADNLELEFLLDSEISRKLASGSDFETSKALIASKAVADCGRGKAYSSCLPPPNGKPPKGETCGHCKREGCPK